MTAPMPPDRLARLAALVDAPGQERDRMLAAAGGEMVAEIVRLRARAERDRVDLVRAWNDLLDVRGHLSPNGYPRRVPMEIHERVAPAVEWLLARVDTLEADLDRLRAQLAEESP